MVLFWLVTLTSPFASRVPDARAGEIQIKHMFRQAEQALGRRYYPLPAHWLSESFAPRTTHIYIRISGNVLRRHRNGYSERYSLFSAYTRTTFSTDLRRPRLSGKYELLQLVYTLDITLHPRHWIRDRLWRQTYLSTLTKYHATYGLKTQRNGAHEVKLFHR